MNNYKKITGLSLVYLPMQDRSIKTPNINGKRVPWKNKTYGKPDNWHESIKYYGIKLTDLLVIDIDNKSISGNKPTDKEQASCEFALPRLKTILSLFPFLSSTYIEITQSGGFHIWTMAIPEFNRKQIDIGNNSIDLLTGDNFLACANINLDKTQWHPGEYAVYNDSNELASMTIVQLNTLIKLYGNKVDNVIPIKENAAYFQNMSDTTGIPQGKRDAAIFQLMTLWYKKGKDLSEARSAYQSLTIDRQDPFELDDMDNFTVKYANICAKESGRSENRLAWAKENIVYIKSTDEVYFVPDRLPRTTDNMKKRHRELYPSGKLDASGEPKYVQLFDMWMNLPDRTMVDGVGFCPTDKTQFSFNKRKYCNLYHDRRYEPWGSAVNADDKDISGYIEMIHNLLANDQRTIDLYFSSLSHKLKHLDSRQMWAWYLITPEKGVGKGLSWDIQVKLNGNYGQKADVDKLTNQFNSYKFTSLNILVDEADDVNKKSNGINAMNALKMLITDSFDNVHFKGKDIGLFQMPIFCSVEMHSNHAERLKIDNNERRVAIVLSRNKPLANSLYEDIGNTAFPPVNSDDNVVEHSDKFFRKVTRYLFDYQIHEDFNLQRAPATLWKEEVCELSRDKFTATLLEAFNSGNEFVKSDLQTQQSLRLMLEHEYNYKKLLNRDLINPMEELIQIGAVKVVKEKFSGLEHIEIEDNGYQVTFHKKKIRGNPKLYAIRNFKDYENARTKELKKHYYPFATEAAK